MDSSELAKGEDRHNNRASLVLLNHIARLTDPKVSRIEVIESSSSIVSACLTLLAASLIQAFKQSS